MYFHENTYDIDILTRQNLHIHTNYSNCAKDEMVVKDIIDAAEKAGLDTIALVDHFNDDNSNEQCIERNGILRRQAQQTGTKLRILFGNELSCYGVGKTLENEQVRKILDYKLYACNHYHVGFWEHPEDPSPRGYAVHAYGVISSLLKSGKADCIAHPIVGGHVSAMGEDKCALTRAMTDNELGDLLTLAREHETAFEINISAIRSDPVFAKRMWSIGKEAGTVFNFGTDAHRLQFIDTKELAQVAKEILE
ncbi:MAG: PHP domain-containing protein [Clostridiales bacterium]|jgi:histidinol phosphatase-like PHP family hydrolase|nr:PHP domain-containing protein [Clostridiales bacterium]